jgi:hypothetical protein
LWKELEGPEDDYPQCSRLLACDKRIYLSATIGVPAQISDGFATVEI